MIVLRIIMVLYFIFHSFYTHEKEREREQRVGLFCSTSTGISIKEMCITF